MPRPNVVLAAAVFALIVALTGVLAGSGNGPTVAVRPVESYDSTDLARAADAREELAESRLTPQERDVVDSTAEVLDRLATGDAVIAPATTSTTSTPPPTTSTTTTTTLPPPTTGPSADWWRDQHLADLVTTTVPA